MRPGDSDRLPRQPDPGAPGRHAPGPPPPTLKRRRDFLAAARARSCSTPGLVLQARQRREDEAEGGPRVGYTCSKKVGGAVERNRAKRRLREAARILIPTLGRPGWDYVLIGRAGATTGRRFDDLLGDLAAALERVHRPPRKQDDGAGEPRRHRDAP